MEQVDVILSGGSVLTMDAGFSLFDPGAVVVRGGEIVAVGPADKIAAGYEATEVVDCTGKAVMPGLINAHTHVPMALLRGLADDLRLDVWLMGYIMPVEREFVRPDCCWLGTQLAGAEMPSPMPQPRPACVPSAGRRSSSSLPPMPRATTKAWRAPAISSSAGKATR